MTQHKQNQGILLPPEGEISTSLPILYYVKYLEGETSKPLKGKGSCKKNSANKLMEWS